MAGMRRSRQLRSAVRQSPRTVVERLVAASGRLSILHHHQALRASCPAQFSETDDIDSASRCAGSGSPEMGTDGIATISEGPFLVVVCDR